MAMASSPENLKISLTLLVDEEKNKVLYAEADNDFVDILRSFLTLPLGTISTLVSKDSSTVQDCTFNCISTLRQSIENLDPKNFASVESKTKLLNQTNPSMEAYSRNLVYDFHKAQTSNFFHQGFLKKSERFIVSDDLTLMPWDLNTTLWIHRNFRTDCVPQRLNVTVTDNEVPDLLKLSLWSNTPLTDLFLCKKLNIIQNYCKIPPQPPQQQPSLIPLGGVGYMESAQPPQQQPSLIPLGGVSYMESAQPPQQQPSLIPLGGVGYIGLAQLPQSQPSLIPLGEISYMESAQQPHLKISDDNLFKGAWNGMKLKVMIKKSESKILVAQAEEDFTNQILSFLTITLGALERLVHGNLGFCCIDNLYKSLKHLNDLKNKLLNPVDLKNKMRDHMESAYRKTIKEARENRHYSFNESSSGSGIGCINNNGYVCGKMIFMVGDDLCVEPFSPEAALSFLRESQVVEDDDIEVRDLKIGVNEVFEVLKASMMTSSALTTSLGPLLVKKERVAVLGVGKQIV